ncbi:hypothetical protein UCRPA7_1411 [Phaeoacremonium minimum UCRPA7]|uniref:Uncharacterized protein n=1 Tax=Phaeoacremonium minimum (strain UCR-PA7) TaxID=1286976 RepID=R8BUT7_PHAM7|nr:hypothetical protein UCRPA7_1411 [Phaeoacremonium minimum UCRPA7]EOO03075.1 hypothetical protein UCRPA7_1411 [Phaeoacremonium minimum UCRPA7]
MDEPHTHTEEEKAPRKTQTRKRQSDSDDDKPQPKRVRLTRKNLAAFNKMGKKKKTSDDDSGSTKTKTTSTTSSGFAEQVYKNGVRQPPYAKPPPNLGDIRERLARSRATASPPELEYKRYINKVEGAPNEATMVVEVSRRLPKEYDDKGYSQVFNQAFTNFPEDVGLNNGLSAPQPDFIEGLRMPEYGPFPVGECVGGAVPYKDDPNSLTLPHLAGEWKGPGKNMKEARMQAAYDGAALVYARNQALDTMGKPYLAGHAKVMTFTTDGTNLNLFTHHIMLTEEGTLEYHQHPIKSINLIDSHEGYKEGRKHLRNAQDLAKEESYALRDELKDYWRARRAQPVPLPTIEDDYEVVEHQPVYQPTPPTSSKPKHSKPHHSHSPPHSSKAPSSTHGSTASSGQKRRASSSQESSSSSSRHKYKSYWKKDAMSGRYYHQHSDGTVSWLDDDEEDGRD